MNYIPNVACKGAAAEGGLWAANANAVDSGTIFNLAKPSGIFPAGKYPMYFPDAMERGCLRLVRQPLVFLCVSCECGRFARNMLEYIKNFYYIVPAKCNPEVTLR